MNNLESLLKTNKNQKEENKIFPSNMDLDIASNSSNESFEDINLVVTKESYISNYDFIALMNKKNQIFSQITIENYMEIFSFNVNFFETMNKKLKTSILITG